MPSRPRMTLEMARRLVSRSGGLASPAERICQTRRATPIGAVPRYHSHESARRRLAFREGSTTLLALVMTPFRPRNALDHSALVQILDTRDQGQLRLNHCKIVTFRRHAPSLRENGLLLALQQPQVCAQPLVAVVTVKARCHLSTLSPCVPASAMHLTTTPVSSVCGSLVGSRSRAVAGRAAPASGDRKVLELRAHCVFRRSC
jgi:hypothetical protein